MRPSIKNEATPILLPPGELAKYAAKARNGEYQFFIKPDIYIWFNGNIAVTCFITDGYARGHLTKRTSQQVEQDKKSLAAAMAKQASRPNPAVYRDRFAPGDQVTWRNDNFATRTGGRDRFGRYLTVKEVREVTSNIGDIGHTQWVTLEEDPKAGFGLNASCFSGAYFCHAGEPFET
jgi:hypothetical protein